MKKRNIENLFLICVIATLITIFFKAYVCWVENPSEMLKIDSIIDIFKERNTYFMIVFLFFLISVIKEYYSVVAFNIYKYRYIIAIGIFVLCVVFEITGSSVGMWCTYLGEVDEEILFGVSRLIRSDEWAVSTPMLYSQYYNYPESFSYFSNTVRACSTDVFLEYGQPVKNILMIFRPFYLGYLFLPIAKGMAFFWCGRWITLFMTSFEFGMLITKRKKGLSLIWACMLVFAPVVQWWFAVNGFVEMLIYVQLSIVILWKYMQTNVLWKRIIYILIIDICAGGFILTFYPSWQIPLGYVLLGLIIWSIIENYKICKMKFIDWCMVCGGIIVLVGAMCYLFVLSGNTITTILNTTYPGSRLETGGGMYQQFYNYMSNIWYAMTGSGTGVNVCESSHFIDLFPVSIILPIIVLVKQKKKDKLLVILLSISLFLGIYCSIGFIPELSKVLLLSFSQSSRTIIIFQFCNIILLIRCLAFNMEFISNKISLRIIVGVLSLYYIWNSYTINKEFWKSGMLVITYIMLIVLFFGCFHYTNKKCRYIWNSVMLVIMLLSGLLVNPIRSGTDSISNITLIKELNNMKNNNPNATWIIENQGLPYNNLGLIAGISTINSTNIYPEIDRWKKVDKENNYEEIYNRYAHIKIVLEDNQNPQFLLESPDAFCVLLNEEMLRVLGVDYILTDRNLHDQDFNLSLVKQVNNYNIYQLE